MHVPSIITGCLAILALACITFALQTIRLRRSSNAVFDGGILFAAGLLMVSALPILSHLPWAKLADEVSDQFVAALHLLEIAYVILTL